MYIYVYTGRTVAVEKNYYTMKKYVDYCTSMATDDLVDWCHVDEKRIVDVGLTSTAYYYVGAMLLSRFAKITGRYDDQTVYAALAEKIKNAFNRKYYKGNGIYAEGELTALGCALYQGLVEDSELELVVRSLVESVCDNGCRPDFGILGEKYVPRALAENGHIDLAFKMITQSEFPGWMHWLE
ncbi:MAG: hypothetical protein GY750_19815 [Lentisphaerae bacterium]|nr:hypothetical protein [Lentisphaerota bacterium]MCP4103642.1 hypothetical protein [Lentisphaerota bacterium]